MTATDENKIDVVDTEAAPEVAALAVAPEVAAVADNRGPRGGRGDRRKNERKPSRRPERARQEFDNKIVSLRRVTRVVSGGRRFSFSVSIVIGDRKGRVGVGLGKAGDTPIAVEKAMRDAKKNMVTVKLHNGTIPHGVEAKYASSTVLLMRAPGKGIVAGSAVRTVLELAGVKEVSAKILSRSKNKLNIARAAVKALSMLKSADLKIKK